MNEDSGRRSQGRGPREEDSGRRGRGGGLEEKVSRTRLATSGAHEQFFKTGKNPIIRRLHIWGNIGFFVMDLMSCHVPET